MAGSQGRARRRLSAPRRLPPSPQRAGTAGRVRGGSKDGRGWGALGRRLQFSCSAAQPEPRLVASPVPLRAEPGPVNTAPALHQPGLEQGHPKIYAPCCPLRNHPRAGGRCALLEGEGGGGREEESAPLRPGMGLGGRGAHRGSAATSLRSPPPFTRTAPHRLRTKKALETWLPAPPPTGLGSLPAPTPLPQRRAAAGQRRPPGLGPRPSSRRSGASQGGSPSELASSCLKPPTYLPRIGGWGRRGPVLLPLLGGRAGGPGGDSAGLSRLGPGLTGRDRWALLRGAARLLREERRPREGLEESAACTATAALIPGAGREHGAGGGGEGAAGSGRGAGRGRARPRAGAECAHTHARANALSRTPLLLPLLSCAPPFSVPPSRWS